MKMIKATVLSLAVTGALAGGQAVAGVEANIGATSNYIWRGVSQSDDRAAVSGGLDWSNDSGFYLGTWASSLGGAHYEQDLNGDYVPRGAQYELDLYGGFGGEIEGGFGYDVGVIAYLYPIGDVESDFTEVYLNGSYGMFNAGVAYTVDTEAGGSGDLYASAGLDFDLGNDMGLGLTFGSYSFDADSSADYTHVNASISKGDFTFAIDKTDQDDAAGDPRVSVSWGATF